MKTRREFLKRASVATPALSLSCAVVANAQQLLPRRAIPGTDEMLPVVGLGNGSVFLQGNLSATPALLVKSTDHHEPDRSAETLAAGTFLIFDDWLLHRGLANQSKLTRRMAYFSYSQKGYVGNTHFEA